MVKIAGETRDPESEESYESSSTDSSLNEAEQKAHEIAAARKKVFRSSPVTYSRGRHYESSTLFYRRRLTSN